MIESSWPAAHVIAAILWTVSLALAIGDLFLGRDDVGHLGMIFAVAAATFNVRCWLSSLSRRELTAFELGRDAGPRRSR